MARVLLVVFPEPGHLHVPVCVAQRLAGAGHPLAFFAQHDLRERLTRAGLDAPTFFVGDPPPWQAAGARTRAVGRVLADPRWRARWMRKVFLGSVPAQLTALRACVASFRPDVLCVDPMAYAGAIVAEQERLPWAAVAPTLAGLGPPSWPCPLFEAMREQAPAREALLHDQGVTLSERGGELVSPWLNVAFTTEAFIPRALSGNRGSFLVGPARPLGARGDETAFDESQLTGDRPAVYMAFGAGAQTAFAPATFIHAAEAAARLGVQLVAALGDLLDEPFARALPGDVVALRYAPQRRLLARVDAMIGHGGANSVMECLDAGKPSIILPLAHEQPLQARFIEASGAGLWCEPTDLTTERAASMLGALVAAGSTQRRRAREIGEDYAHHDGAAEAAALITELATERRPRQPSPAGER
jgi:MGT family glycosyltransferase